MRPDFARATREATRLLAMQKDTNWVMSMTWIKRDKNIIFDTMQRYCALTGAPLQKFMDHGALKDGCTVYDPQNDLYIVFYNFPIRKSEGRHVYLSRLNWTLAHELGHIYLGHTRETPIAEIEANHFAAQLLMPEVSMCSIKWMFPDVTADDISDIFMVSKVAAEKRLKTLRKHYEFVPGKESDRIWKLQKDMVFYHFKEKGERR